MLEQDHIKSLEALHEYYSKIEPSLLESNIFLFCADIDEKLNEYPTSCLELLAIAARNANNRNLLGKRYLSYACETLKKYNFNEEIKSSAIRFLANISADSPENRSLLLLEFNSSIEKLLEILACESTSNSLRKLALTALNNFCIDCIEIVEYISKSDYISMIFDTFSPNDNDLQQFFIFLSHFAEIKEIVLKFWPRLLSVLNSIFSVIVVPPEQENDLSSLELFVEILREICLHIAQDNDKLLEVLQTPFFINLFDYISNDSNNIITLETLCKFLVEISLKLDIPESHGSCEVAKMLKKYFLEWINNDSSPTTNNIRRPYGCLALGNLLNSDSEYILLLRSNLLKWSVIEQMLLDNSLKCITQIHAAVSLLRHLSIPLYNREILSKEKNVINYMLPSLQTENPNVFFNAIAIIKLLYWNSFEHIQIALGSIPTLLSEHFTKNLSKFKSIDGIACEIRRMALKAHCLGLHTKDNILDLPNEVVNLSSSYIKNSGFIFQFESLVAYEAQPDIIDAPSLRKSIESVMNDNPNEPNISNLKLELNKIFKI